MAKNKTAKKKPAVKKPAVKKPAKKTAAKKPAAKKKAAAKKKPAAKKKAAAKKPAKKPAAKSSGKTGVMSARMKQIVARADAIHGKGYYEPTKVKCPLCRNGVIVPKRGRFGAEWRCDADARPMCKFKVETKPTGKKCTVKRRGKACGSLMVAGTKTIPDRCSDKTCPNRNPHKL